MQDTNTPDTRIHPLGTASLIAASAIVLACGLVLDAVLGRSSIPTATMMVVAIAIAAWLVLTQARWPRLLAVSLTGILLPLVISMVLPRGTVQGPLADALGAMVTMGVLLPMTWTAVTCAALLIERQRAKNRNKPSPPAS